MERDGAMPERLGPYEVLGELGRGGMGVVYLAHDPSLLRRVAIKVLPDAVTRDPQRSARFEREARLLASINHPNIAVVHNLERAAGGAAYLVMEYIEGESLAARIRRGRIPLPEALRIGRRVAKALEAAHARGVIHRDLKPPNVMIGEDDLVKVLDFGLARRSSDEPDDGGGPAETTILSSASAPLASPPQASPPPEPEGTAHDLTGAGEIVGTPGYLSPEQARGLPAGRPADLFAFGCLLFECLAGQRAFAGVTAQELLRAVLREEPDWKLLPADTPPGIRNLIARCVSKDPRQRPESMAAVRRSLEEAMERPISGLTRRHNLPREISSFVGREESISRILQLLRSTPLLALTGPGGCGKSRLALRAGMELVSEFTDGVWRVELASISDPAGVAAAVASALELREAPGRPLASTCTEGIGARNLLLILDNCEHLVEACASLAQQLLQSCPNLKILATTRESLGVTGEASLQVPSLSVPARGDVARKEDLSRYEACRLFVERASRAGVEFRVTEAEASAIGRICQRLDGMPLAIELAAARTRVLPVAQIEARLDDRFRLLTGGSRTALQRHQTLRATLDWSYALLGAEEQRWFRTLSVFAGGWSLRGALSLAGEDADEIDVVDVLTRLTDKSLIIGEPATDPPRHRMLETVRQYALEKCREEGESESVRDRHLDCYVGLLEQAKPHLFGGPEQKRWLDELESEHENFQAAFEWSDQAAGREVKALMVVVLLAQFWYLRGHGQLARSLLLRALDRAEPAGADNEWLNWRAGALNAAAHFLTSEGEFTRARSLIEEAVAIRRRIGPTLDLARVLFTLGANLWMSNRFSEATRAHREALALSRQQGHRDMTATSLNAVGVDLFSGGDLDGARRAFEESLALRRELQDLPNAARVLNNLGTLVALQGDLPEARKYQEEALATQRELKNLSGIVAVLEERGSTLAESGQTDAALQDFAEALDIARRLGERPRVAGLYTRLASVHLRLCRPELAVAPLQQALEAHRAMGSSVDLAQGLFLAAVVAVRCADFSRAARLYGAADTHQGASPFQALPGEMAMIQGGRAAARRALGEAAYETEATAGSALTVEAGVDEALALLAGAQFGRAE